MGCSCITPDEARHQMMPNTAGVIPGSSVFDFEGGAKPEPKEKPAPEKKLLEPVTEAKVEAKPEPEVKPEAQPGTETEPEADPEPVEKLEADPEPEAKLKANPELEADLEADLKPEAKLEENPKPEAQLETKQKPVPSQETEMELEEDPEPEELKANPEPQGELEADPEPEVKLEAKLEPEAQLEAKQKPVPSPKKFESLMYFQGDTLFRRSNNAEELFKDFTQSSTVPEKLEKNTFIEYFNKQGISWNNTRQLMEKLDTNNDSIITFKEFYENIFLTSKTEEDHSDSSTDEHQELRKSRTSRLEGAAKLEDEPGAIADAKVSEPVEVLSSSPEVLSSGKSSSAAGRFAGIIPQGKSKGILL